MARHLALLLLLLSACQVHKTTCGPSNCDGCCDQTGACLPGSEAAACGLQGQVCSPCDTPRLCNAGFCGNPDLGDSDAGVLCRLSCAGCCLPDQTCVLPGSGLDACGTAGAACEACRPSQQCLTSVCRNPSCAGCVEADGGCAPGDAGQACGAEGGSCSNCGPLAACHSGRCACTGCKSLSGRCFAGTAASACGSGGAFCASCGSGQCDAGHCTPAPAPDAGCAAPGSPCGSGVGCCSGTCSGSVCSAVDAGPLAGDACARPLELVLSTAGIAAISGSTVGLANDSTSGGCNSSGPDVVYTFTTSAVTTLTATVTASSSGFIPTVYVRALSCQSGLEYVCNTGLAGGSAQIQYAGLPPGAYYLWVDGAGSTSGPFNLDVTVN